MKVVINTYLNDNRTVRINNNDNVKITIGINLFKPSLKRGIIKKVNTKHEPKSGCKKIKNTGKKIISDTLIKSLLLDNVTSKFDKNLLIARTVPNLANSAG